MSEKAISEAIKCATDVLQLEGFRFHVVQLPQSRGNPEHLDKSVATFLAHDEKLPRMGFLFVSGNANKLTYSCYIAEDLQKETDLTPAKWVGHIHANLTDQEAQWEKGTRGAHVTGSLLKTDDHSVYPEKIREEVVAHGFGILRKNKLLPDEEDDFVVDMEAAGLGAW